MCVCVCLFVCVCEMCASVSRFACACVCTLPSLAWINPLRITLCPRLRTVLKISVVMTPTNFALAPPKTIAERKWCLMSGLRPVVSEATVKERGRSRRGEGQQQQGMAEMKNAKGRSSRADFSRSEGQ